MRCISIKEGFLIDEEHLGNANAVLIPFSVLCVSSINMHGNPVVPFELYYSILGSSYHEICSHMPRSTHIAFLLMLTHVTAINQF